MWEAIELQEVPTKDSFDEKAYVDANPDVASAISAGRMRSGAAHFRKFGRAEERRQVSPIARTPQAALDAIAASRGLKLVRLAPFLSRPPRAIAASGALDYLDAASAHESLFDSSEGVSENGYDEETMAALRACADGLLLDVGAGRRPVYFGNVVNFEVAAYDTTDVMGDGADLPLRDGSFDSVLSIAVLEYARDPFKCAAEIARVLKPGGWLKCCVPFLKPLHGYPNHYFNMTHEGLRTLFEPHLVVERQDVTEPLHPLWGLSWQIRVWAQALPPAARKDFLRMRVEDLIGHPAALLSLPFARELPEHTRFELAAATILVARKGS